MKLTFFSTNKSTKTIQTTMYLQTTCIRLIQDYYSYWPTAVSWDSSFQRVDTAFFIYKSCHHGPVMRHGK